MRVALGRPSRDLVPAVKLFDKARERLKRRCTDREPYTTLADPKVQLAFGFNAREHASYKAEANVAPKELSGSLPLYFDFYAKMQTPQAQMAQRSLTYLEIQHCNERLSYFELLVFCRDVGIVPDLIPKQTLEYVWKLSTMSGADRSETHHAHADSTASQLKDVGLDLSEFLKILVRIALVTFAEAAMGAPRLAVEKFAVKLNLKSVNFARNHIRTTGRETQRRLNFRSAGETNKQSGRQLLRERQLHANRKHGNEENAASGLEDYITADQLDTLKTMVRSSDLTANAASNALSIVQEVLLAQYEPSMVEWLEPYCVARLAQVWLPFPAGLGIEFLELHKGHRYSAKIEIRNVSNNILVVTSFKKRGGEKIDDAVKAVFDPGPFAPGLTRRIDLTFAPPETAASGPVVGCLDVELSSCKTSGVDPVSIPIPVYFNVKSSF